MHRTIHDGLQFSGSDRPSVQADETRGGTASFEYTPYTTSTTPRPLPRVSADDAIGILTSAIAAQERQDRLCRLLACLPEGLEGKIAELLRAQEAMHTLARALREVR
jgi:hypothetical protein